MIYEQFLELVKRNLEERMGEEYSFDISQTLKNNGEYRSGLRVKISDTNIYPCIYMEPYYDNFIHGRESLEELLDSVMKSVRESVIKEPIDISFFTDWEKVKPNVFCKVINTEQNQEMLSIVPHKEVLDLSIIYQVNVGFLLGEKDAESGSIIVRNEHIQLWGITSDMLYECAIKNMKDKQKAELRDIASVIEELLEVYDNDSFGDNAFPMYILRSENSIHGATQLIMKDTLLDVADKLNGDFVILPSSIYELIVLPASGITDFEELRKMVEEVNDTQVPPIDRLSYHVYRFDKEREALEIVA